ncbi:MAG: hypothetical protein VKL98_00905 [Cyanobacteriota bacterium]|nr:hypothetical protein [Cyanobacteriota bacterium]
MKPAWPRYPLSRWSRRLLRLFSLAIASFFMAISLAIPATAALDQSSRPGPALQPVEPGSLLAQDTSNNSTLHFNTANYVVSVHPRNTTALKMNVYRRTSPSRSEALNNPVTYRGSLNNDGWVSYDAFGSRDGRNVIFRAIANPSTRQARLEILDASTNSIILSENSTSITAMNVPTQGGTGGDQLRDTLVGFETQNYAVRVFRQANSTQRKVNVFNKASQQQVVNGQPATAVVNAGPPYECWVTYFGGIQYNGAPAQYFIRVSSSGEALIEAISANGTILMSEPRINTSPLITNIPLEDRPQCFGSGNPSTSPSNLSPFIAAVFGGETELNQLKQLVTSTNLGGGRGISGGTCVIDPRIEGARQGDFISVAECDNRNDAGAVVNFLRGRGYNSRLVYRNFRYR